MRDDTNGEMTLNRTPDDIWHSLFIERFAIRRMRCFIVGAYASEKSGQSRSQEGVMPVKIGFAILSYNEPGQLLRLTQTLTAMFGAPPIACHHNFGQCQLDESLFPENVRFVRPYIFTKWGHVTTPLAALRAFRSLRENDRPDWYVLLSGSDYPVQPAEKISAELDRSSYDAYLDHREIVSWEIPAAQTQAISGFGRPDWIPLAYDRYLAIGFWWPRPSRKMLQAGVFPYIRKGYFYHLRDERITRWIQIHRPAHIYAGCFWFQANARAIDRLLDGDAMRRLVRHFRGRRVPEEGLFHSALCGRPDLRISTNHYRYEDWSHDIYGSSPKWLGVEDLPNIAASGAHFARKFRPDGVVQDRIDRTMLGIL
jgi:hypothetical protein